VTRDWLLALGVGVAVTAVLLLAALFYAVMLSGWYF